MKIQEDYIRTLERDLEKAKREKVEQHNNDMKYVNQKIVSNLIIGIFIGFLLAYLMAYLFGTDQATAEANTKMLLHGIVLISLLILLLCLIRLTVVDWLRKWKVKKNGGTYNEEKIQ